MSIWKSFEHDKNELKENKKVDILIIGGSLTGLLTAYKLKDKDVCVVEARSVGSGTTKNTTAKITYLQERVYTKIASTSGKEKAKVYLDSQLKSIKEYEKIINEEKIDCNFTKTPSYIFANKKSEISKIRKEAEFLKNQKINIEKTNLDVETNCFLAYKVNDTYTFNPLKFIKGLYEILTKNDIKVYENTIVYNVKKEKNKYICKCNNFSIEAKKVVFASSYPYFIFPIILPLKSYIEKSYIYVSKINDYKNISCISSNPTYSCRYYKNGEEEYQISLGGSHNTAYKQNDEKNFLEVKKMFNLKDENILMNYSNTDIITSDYMPYIGEFKKNMYIGCGYNTWGMTNSMLSSVIISDLITKGVNEYSNIFNPKRINLITILKLPLNLINQIKSFISSKIIKNKSWYKDSLKIKGNVAIYTDENKIKHKVKTTCPHMGCGLIFNELEKTWDCPCHSSKFDIDGNILKGPSNKNIKL